MKLSLYDRQSNINWFYDGIKTKDDMKTESKYSPLFLEDCVLFDNGIGQIYKFETLKDMLAKYEAQDFEHLEDAIKKSWVKVDKYQEQLDEQSDALVELADLISQLNA